MTKLIELVDRYRQGPYPVFAAGPFLSIASLCAKNLRFTRVLTGAEEMAEAALLNLNLGGKRDVSHYLINLIPCSAFGMRGVMPRLARLEAPGNLHHVIIRGIERKDIFRDTTDKQNLVDMFKLALP